MSRRAKWIVVILWFTWIMHEVYIFGPKGDEVYKFYPFSDQLVSKQYYIFGACNYAIALILVAIIRFLLLPEARKIMTLFVWFQFLELIEYFLTYNREFFKTEFMTEPIELTVGLNITSIKIVTMFLLIGEELWKHGRK